MTQGNKHLIITVHCYILVMWLLWNFLFFWLHLQHMEVPRPGNESELQLQPTPQLQQCHIVKPLYRAGDQTHASAMTQAHASAMTQATTETMPDPWSTAQQWELLFWMFWELHNINFYFYFFLVNLAIVSFSCMLLHILKYRNIN